MATFLSYRVSLFDDMRMKPKFPGMSTISFIMGGFKVTTSSTLKQIVANRQQMVEAITRILVSKYDLHIHQLVLGEVTFTGPAMPICGQAKS